MKIHLLFILLLIATNSLSQNYNKLFKTIEAEDFDKAIILVEELSLDKKVDSTVILLANALIYSNKNFAFYNPLKAYSAYRIMPENKPFTYSKKAIEIAEKFSINLNELKIHIENKIYEQVSITENTEKLKQIILLCNQCTYLEKANIHLENIEYNNAKMKNSLEDYNVFIINYPNSSRVNEMIEKRDVKAFEKAKNNLKDLNEFILKYPESKLINVAFKVKDSIINNAESIHYYENGNIFSRGKYKIDLEEGFWVYYNEDGRIDYSCNYKNGLLNGEYKQYEENGSISSIKIYENGEELFSDGELITFHSNGQIKSKCFYKNGKLDGLKIEYNYKGVVIKKENYYRGKLSGLSILRCYGNEIYESQNYLNGLKNGEGTKKINGCIEIENYLNDTLNGDYIKKDRNGEIICSGQYKDGERIGYWIWSDPNVKLMWQGNVTDGIVEHYDYKGNICEFENYKNGELNGPHKSTYNGITVEEGSFLNGVANGYWKLKYSNGKLKFSGNCSAEGAYVDLNKFESLNNADLGFIDFPIFYSGNCEFFYDNGSLLFKGNFTNGEVNYYLKDGKLYINEKYKNGKKISKTEYYDSELKPQIHTIKLDYTKESVSKIELFVNNLNLNEIKNYRFINLNNYCEYEFEEDKEKRLPIQVTIYKNDTIIFNVYSKCTNEFYGSEISSQNTNEFKTGKISYFDEDLRKISEGEILNGEKVGLWKIYNRNGEILESHYSKDEIKTYYSNGTIYSIEKCKNYILNGESIFYYENGNVKSIMHYLNGKRDCQMIE